MRIWVLSYLAVVLASKVTPVTKVIQLLNAQLEKGKDEKHKEQVQFAAYRQFCDDTTQEKEVSIKEANAHMESLASLIEKGQVEADRLDGEIAAHETDIATWQGDAKAALKVREVERTDFTTTHKDYSESIDALERAIAVLKKQNFDRKQAAALVAIKTAPLIPRAAKEIIDTFLQGVDDLEDPPEANAYEFQSSSVVEMLEKLHDKFQEERYTLEKEEANAKHAHSLLQQDLSAQVATAEETRTSKKEERASYQQQTAEAKGDLADTTSTRDDDQAYLTDLVGTCRLKSDDFQSRQALRAGEIEAIEKALEILSSDAVAGSAAKHLPGDVSLLQLRLGGRSPRQARAAAYLSSRAKEIHSHVLSALAVHAEDDPFSKVKKMITDLITRLQEQANQEAEHKGWCTTELSTNEQTRKSKSEAVESLHADIDTLTSGIAKLTDSVAELSAQVVELDRAVQKASENRAEEKANNQQTLKDAEGAQVALAKAVMVLKEFYMQAGKATALLQQPKAPEIFDQPYKGMQAENGGVIGMLEVIQSDFARLETETKTSEASAQRQHEKFLSDSAVDKAQKNKDIEHKNNKKVSDENSLTMKREDLRSTQKELDAALSYYDKLKPSCVNAGVSYEDRVSRRKEEIQSLQEALRILNGEDIA